MLARVHSPFSMLRCFLVNSPAFMVNSPHRSLRRLTRRIFSMPWRESPSAWRRRLGWTPNPRGKRHGNFHVDLMMMGFHWWKHNNCDFSCHQQFWLNYFHDICFTTSSTHSLGDLSWFIYKSYVVGIYNQQMAISIITQHDNRQWHYRIPDVQTNPVWMSNIIYSNL